MMSSPLSSNLSTPPPAKRKQPPTEEELEEEPDEEGLDEEIEEHEGGEENGEISQNESIQEPRPPKQAQEGKPAQLPAQRQRHRRIIPKKPLGTTVLPISRVSRAAKQDKDLKVISKEALFLISIATEYFVKKLTDSAFERASRERRVFVRYNDVATAVQRNLDYDWLEEVIPVSASLGSVLRNPTIPVSSIAITNQLPTETLITSSNNLPLEEPESMIKANADSDHLDPNSYSNPPLPSTLDDPMEVEDQDELDEEF